MFSRLPLSEGIFWSNCVSLPLKLILGCLRSDAQAGLVGEQLDLGQTQIVTDAAVVSGEAPHTGFIWPPSLFYSHLCVGGTWRRVSLPRGDRTGVQH